ncbi:E3 ubiquitin-protein ligase RAD18-like [Macrobrachium nipponense]|uniref:E3 ubiquitin-protein ligase RAD18-like n=1 Tax=Macrobrachium nipponense TaxID=159736 RepID=UPI0030C8866E
MESVVYPIDCKFVVVSAMAVETSLPWPASIPELKRLDELLRCGICYEFMSTSMVTVCSHNFCSMCIRQYLGYKTQCPACFQETTGQQLRNNRLLDEIILLFPALRDKTARQCQSAKGNTISGYLVKEDDSNDSSGSANADVNVLSPDVRSKLKREDYATPSQATSSDDLLSTPRSSKTSLLTETPKRGLMSASSKRPLASSSSSSSSRPSNGIFISKSSVRSPSTVSASQSPSTSASLSQSGRQSVSGFFSIIGERAGSDTATEEPKVACPVCNVRVPERNINLHLDACLKRMEEGDKEEVVCVDQQPKRKPLPKLVYSLLSEKQLRQMLKEVGLSIQGDRQQLSNRHRRYTTLYNVECDAAEPRHVQEILRQVEREEKEETKGLSKSIFTYDRKTPVEVIEKEQVNYLKKNDNHFAKLIADVKKRREEGKKKKLKEPIEEEQHEEKVMYTPGTSKAKSRPGSKSKTQSNHHLSGSDNESDGDSSKKKTATGVVATKSILNFFQNSPKKSSQSASEKSGSSNHIIEKLPDNLMITDDDDDFFSENFVETNDSKSLPSESNDFPLLKSEASAEELKVNGCAAHIKLEMEETMKCSPDIFSASPTHSDCSDDSVSLLKDQEGEVEDILHSGPMIKEEAENESDEEFIPGCQPDSCPLDSQPERSPSPAGGNESYETQQVFISDSTT